MIRSLHNWRSPTAQIQCTQLLWRRAPLGYGGGRRLDILADAQAGEREVATMRRRVRADSPIDHTPVAGTASYAGVATR